MFELQEKASHDQPQFVHWEFFPQEKEGDVAAAISQGTSEQNFLMSHL